MNIVSQTRILNLVNSSTIDTFPRSVMLVGSEGSGKHLLTSYIAEYLKLQVEDISESINLEKINEITMKVEPYLYVIDTRKITVKEENTILKFVEEPLKNSYIVILTESKNRLLDTVINRCQVWELENYTKDVLMQFIQKGAVNRDVLLDICTTPGQVKKYSTVNIEEYIELAKKIVDKISIASLPNTLTIADKLSYKDERDKLDVNIFLNVLLYVCRKEIMERDNIFLYSMYNLTDKLKNDSLIANIDKKKLVESYLVNLWEVSRSNEN